MIIAIALFHETVSADGRFAGRLALETAKPTPVNHR
jgi:hypothetical protein